MQLIAVLILALSLIILTGAILFISAWQRSRRDSYVAKILREGIGHIGISAIVEYPNTTNPLLSLLDEEYPYCEAIIVTDLQRYSSTFKGLIRKFHLARVNHTHLQGVRSLYRSRHRTFRRVVIVDLPIEHRSKAVEVAKRVASFDYTLHLKGECEIARNALTYCANIIALHPTSKALSLETIVGEKVRLERADNATQGDTHYLLINRAFAWRSSMPIFLLTATFTPSVILLFAHILGEKILLLSAAIFTLVFCAILSLSCCAISEKGLLMTTDTIVKNFCRFLVERFKKIFYLYKEISNNSKTTTKRVEIVTKLQNNRTQL